MTGFLRAGRNSSTVAISDGIDNLAAAIAAVLPATTALSTMDRSFPELHVRTLFVQGTRDPFGTPSKGRIGIGYSSAPTKQVAVENARHELITEKNLILLIAYSMKGCKGTDIITS